MRNCLVQCATTGSENPLLKSSTRFHVQFMNFTRKWQSLVVFRARALLRHVSQRCSPRAMTLSRESASEASVTSRHVIRCEEASRCSRGDSPLLYHVTRRGFNSCFAGALSPSLAMVDATVGASVLALQLLLMIIRFTSVKLDPFLRSIDPRT